MAPKSKGAKAAAAAALKARAAAKEQLANNEGSAGEDSGDDDVSNDMRLRSRAEEDALAAEKENLSQTRAAAGKLGAAGFIAALARGEGKQPAIPLRAKGKFVDKTRLNSLLNTSRTKKGTLYKRDRAEIRKERDRLRRKAKQAKVEAELRDNPQFLKAYDVLKKIYRKDKLDPKLHMHTDFAEMVEAVGHEHDAKALGIDFNLLPYMRQARCLYNVHRLVDLGKTTVQARRLVAQGSPFTERTIGKWTESFYANGFRFKRMLSGLNLGKRYSFLDDLDLRAKAKAYIRSCLASGSKQHQGNLSKQQHKEAVERSKALREEREEREAEIAEQLQNEREHAAACARNKERNSRPDVGDDETYCFCNKVASGDMIECEVCFNWFHHTCLEEERIAIGGEVENFEGEWKCGACVMIIEDKEERERQAEEELLDYGDDEEEEAAMEEEEDEEFAYTDDMFAQGYFVLTAPRFHRWVNAVLLKQAFPDGNKRISLSTAKAWLQKLGFTWERKTKTVYIDGHERPDVVEARRVFCNRIVGLCDFMMEYVGPDCEEHEPEFLRLYKAEGGREHVLVVHDEAICQAKDGCVSSYGEPGKRTAANKSTGASLMISGVLSEKTGRVGFLTKKAWCDFQRKRPEEAKVVMEAYYAQHGSEELYDEHLKKYGVRSADIIIKPGKVREGERGGEGGREGRFFGVAMGEVAFVGDSYPHYLH